jgi:hypothetical protein
MMPPVEVQNLEYFNATVKLPLLRLNSQYDAIRGVS